MDVYESLIRELGADRVLRGGEALEPYSRDESGLGIYPPDAAALCRSRAEVELVLRFAAAHKIPVTPRGAGSGMTGGALPVRGGIVLSTEEMKRIVSIDVDDRIAIVEPGVINADLQTAVEAQGMFYAPDPASLEFCSMGGNVAENAGGPRAFKYGVTRDWTLGLEVTLMGGESLRLGRRTPKGVTGYDLTALFVGSEGTFGVTTEITVRLIGRPGGVGTLIAVMPDAVAAGRAVSAVIRKGFCPRVLELLDRATLDHVRPRAPFSFPVGAGAILLIELDGEPEGMEASILRCGSVCEDEGAREVIIARDDADRERLWQARRLCSRSLREAHAFKLSEDIVVPTGAIAETLRRVDAIGARHDLLMATFGHAGDGNLHVNILTDENHHVPAVAARIDAALGDMFSAALDLGGTLSGEHGIGIAKAKYMSWEQSAEVIGWQKRLKQLWDPEDLLNPGKMFLPVG
ncbi:MAG TPA: FAD-linked oxidase C-terminal domain-containing protein [Polyangia bacterium]|jgi:glycolate oxidase|nr:FAD-linked oxidase C-terminal domain-containing protein [Polyangia bacterium]